MISIEKIDLFEGIGAEAWNGLLGLCGEKYIFQNYEFQSTWWKHFGGSRNRRELLLLVAKDQGRLIGIAPLMAEEAPLFKRPIIKFLGTPICDYMDFIIAKGEEAGALDAFYRYLQNLECLEIDLLFVPESAPTVGFGKAAARAIDICPYLDLSEDWTATYKTLNNTIKKYVARRQRSIAKAGKVEFGFVKDKKEMKSFFEGYFRIHVMRWRDYEGRYSQFQYASWRDFAMEISDILFHRGFIDLSYLKLNSEIVASHFGFIYNKIFHWYMPAYNPAYSRYSPGNLFIMELLKRSSTNGLTAFDFLRGDEPYKIFWTDKSRRLFNCVSYPNNRMLSGAGRSFRFVRNIYGSYIKGGLKKLSPLIRIWYKSKGDGS